MPFIDLNKIQNLDKIYDFTIVGAGAAGILFAIKMRKAGFNVNIIESGHFSEDQTKQQLNEIIHKGKFLNSAVWGRKRAIGGTTIAWGGQSLPFSEFDFVKKEWIQNSGWPICYDEIKSFYDEANEFMGIDNWGYHDDMLTRLDLLKRAPKSSDFDYHVSKWAKTPNFAKLHYDFLAKEIDVFFNAHMVNIGKIGNQVKEITIKNFQKISFTIPIKQLIIAAGGIETVRILQISYLSSSPWLGTGFMEHPCIEFGKIINYKPYTLQRLFNTHIYKGRKYSLRLSLSRKKQQEEELLNASVSILFEYPRQGFDPYAEIKRFLSDHKLNELPQLLKSMVSIIPTISSYILNGFLFKPNTEAKLNMMLEQEPLSNSCIYLSEENDIFDQPKAALNWQISDATIKTFLATAKAVDQLLKQNDLGEASIYPYLNKENTDLMSYFSGVNHHMGGARLGNHKDNSVVDANLQLWDFKNVHVCSSAVFVTGSHSNPTLTLLALACRLAGHLQQKQ